jgi:hypothetical protein
VARMLTMFFRKRTSAMMRFPDDSQTNNRRGCVRPKVFRGCPRASEGVKGKSRRIADRKTIARGCVHL